MTLVQTDPFNGLKLFYGDLHNHCDLSYGHGSFEDAVKNAQLQLDFASITLHAVWPDIPEGEPRIEYLVDYHKKAFLKAIGNWPEYLKQVELLNEEGKFVLFPSYEWHSSEFGDHCIYYNDTAPNPILENKSLEELREELRRLPSKSFLIPHHIGYKQGYRGINWSAFTDEFSPVAEIFSFHGSSESSEGPYPYLHTMGPRHELSCAQYGWSRGNVFGVIGSTDHHNAFPGSYGSGRLGVWAKSLTRADIWEAIQKRHTYALTGDRIELLFTLNGNIMGDICPPNPARRITAAVKGGNSIDYIDVLHNNKVIHRAFPLPDASENKSFKILLELGWGEIPEDTLWDVELDVINGKLLGTEPHFRGFGAQGDPERKIYTYSQWQRTGSNQVWFRTQTRPNPSLYTSATEGMSIEIEGSNATIIAAKINGTPYKHSLSELIGGARTHYLGGFVTPAICFHQAVPQSEYQFNFEFIHHHQPVQRDWYYIRVRQKNNQWAWSSPIWIDPS